MFMGIIQTLGEVTECRERPEGMTFVLCARDFCEALRPGDSVSINGACHTVERCDADSFGVTSVGETLARTTMGDLAPGTMVNLEHAATLETALGGHLVQGHVDGVGTVHAFETIGGDKLLTLAVPPEVFDVTVEKGSIAIDGVSLTVIDRLSGNEITITIIPHTLTHTTMGEYAPGRRLNVEADVIGKYVKQYIDRLAPETK